MPKKVIILLIVFLFPLFFKTQAFASDCGNIKSLLEDANRAIATDPLESERLYRNAVSE